MITFIYNRYVFDEIIKELTDVNMTHIRFKERFYFKEELPNLINKELVEKDREKNFLEEHYGHIVGYDEEGKCVFETDNRNDFFLDMIKNNVVPVIDAYVEN